MRRIITAVLAATTLGLLAGCGGGTSTSPPEGEVIIESGPTTPSEFRGGSVGNPEPAPEFGLRTHDGKLVTVDSLRGNVVMVSFLYSRCPDICPIIIEKLKLVQAKAGDKRVKIVVVSVDPKGDTPAAVASFLKAHQATGKVDWLTGSAADLRATWKRWGILAERSEENPALIEHSGVVWIMDKQGRRAVYFPLSTIEVDDLAHDVDVLLRK